MKRYISVFEMIARSSIYKVLLIIGLMVVFESFIDQSHYSLIFKIAYILITIVLVLPGMNIGSVQSYTLQRLRIKEKRIYWLQSLYNFLAYVLLWGVQLMMILASAMVYQKNLPAGAAVSNQTMFMAFYRNDFMHTILPLEDVPGWWMLILFGMTSAFATAECTKLQREGKFGVELVILVAAVMISIPRALGYDLAFPLIAMAVVFCVMGMRWLMNKVGDGGEES